MTGVTGLSRRVVIIPQLRTYPLLLANYKYQESLAAGNSTAQNPLLDGRGSKPETVAR